MEELSSLPGPLDHKYEPLEALSQQPGKETWLAKNRLSGKTVVIKILLFNAEFDWQSHKLFEREAKVLQNLNHPAIPKVLDYVELTEEQSQGFALIQEQVPGKSLATRLQDGQTFSEEELKAIARQILDILIFLHGRQPSIIHRDIKPSNILLADPQHETLGQLYLIDFGAVQTLQSPEGATRTVVGTYGYMPPEQFGGRTVPASDLYSLGATLIFVATGQHPADLPQKNLSIQFESLVDMSPAFTRWIKKLSEPSLDNRFATAGEALEQLNNPHQLVSHSHDLVQKPKHTRVKCHSTSDRLLLHIPPIGFHASLLFLVPFAIAWNSFLVFWCATTAAIPFPGNLVFLLFSLPFWTAGLGMIGVIVFSFFGHIKQEITRDRLVQTFQVFNFRIRWPRPAFTSEIHEIEFIEKHWKRDSEGKRVEAPASIILWAGRKKFPLNATLVLDERELRWLAQEYSDWLGIPVTYR